MFADKLNFLISIVGISGGELAKAISLDPSYISRLRHGKRALPKGQTFLEPIALYFATHIKNDYQKKLVCDAMETESSWPETIEKAQKYILNWFVIDSPRQQGIMRDVFREIAKSFPLNAPVYIENLPDLSEYRNDERPIYFGVKGKQDAFLRFLTIAIDSANMDVEGNTKMQIFCNEDLSWQTQSPGFAEILVSLFRVYAKAGNTIKIIHSISEDTESMLDLLQGWIPIYLTGYVEPYYYPKIREDFYRRTAFVVPGVVAMTSSSLYGNAAESMTFVLTDPQAVAVVESELKYLVAQSKPLTKVFSAKNKEGMNVVLKEFFNSKSDTILFHEDIAPFILPESMRKIKETRGCFYFKSVEKLIKDHNYTEVIAIPDVDKICRGETPVQLSSVVSTEQVYFTKQEYLKNLYYLANLLEAEENYNLLIRNHALQDLFFCIKKDVGIFITKPQKAARAFYIEQPNIVKLVWEFLQTTNQEATLKNQSEVLQTFRELIKEIEARA